MFEFIDNPYFAVFCIGLILGVMGGVAVLGLFKFHQSNDRAAESTRRRQAAEHTLAEEKKAHATTTDALLRQRAICNGCPNYNPGGDDK